ncbi:MAG: glycosyltransferase [Isosphaerales bacterium]
MDESFFVSNASFWTPCHLARSSRWLGHIPFAFWVIDAARPRLIVELGNGPANSYLALCQAVQTAGTGSRCFAVRPRDEILDENDDFRHLARGERLQFNNFSYVIRMTLDESLPFFEDGSIDVLHLTGRHTREGARHAFRSWSPKMSDRGVILLDRTNHYRNDHAFPGLFRELGVRYPTFEFLHDEGLGIVGIGERLPADVEALLTCSRSTSQVDEVRKSYARLGQGLIDDHIRQCLEVLNATTVLGCAASGPGRSTKQAVSDENAILTERVSQLSRELEEISRSLGWKLVRKARGLCRKAHDGGRFLGACRWAVARFVKTLMTEGMSDAVAKSLNRIKQTRHPSRGLPDRQRGGEETREDVPAGSLTQFQQLPWRDRRAARRPAARGGSFKVLLVSHEASRSGAPLCLLRLAERLAQINDLECWIVLDRGGELEGEFEKVAHVLSVDVLMNQGISRQKAPDRIVGLFREYARSGVAICNTACIGPYYEACATHGVPVLAWVHELPATIDGFCGGRQTVAAICGSARRIVTPANVVRDALASHYRIPRDRIQTIYNGLPFEIDTGHRPDQRLRVRKELGLPAAARIVLGCGTIELRKGVDLFTQLARRVLADHSTPDTWFLWLGKTHDPGLKCWLQHDIAAGGSRDRIRFLGPRDNSGPYFLAADVFVLTSREDPCPLVNMEAMASGLPVVAFRNAGGAPELLEGCGLVVPYLDIEAMGRAVVQLLGDPEGRESLGCRAQAKIRSGFTWSRFAEEIVQILEEDYDYRPSSGLGDSGRVPLDARELSTSRGR